MELKSRIAGIPCLISVTRFERHKGSYSYNAPSDVDFYGWVDLDFEVLDRKGYRAKWLEEKLTDDDVSRIHDEIVGVMQ